MNFVLGLLWFTYVAFLLLGTFTNRRFFFTQLSYQPDKHGLLGHVTVEWRSILLGAACLRLCLLNGFLGSEVEQHQCSGRSRNLERGF